MEKKSELLNLDSALNEVVGGLEILGHKITTRDVIEAGVATLGLAGFVALTVLYSKAKTPVTSPIPEDDALKLQILNNAGAKLVKVSTQTSTADHPGTTTYSLQIPDENMQKLEHLRDGTLNLGQSKVPNTVQITTIQ